MSDDVVVQVEETTPAEPEVQAEESEARAAVEAVRRALAEVRAPDGVALDTAVRGLGRQLAEAQAELEQSRAEVARLQPLADQGRAYRDELINQAVAEGVRALGETFPEETYRAMLANAPLEHIRQVRDTFAAQAAERFPGGRQTRDENKSEQPKRSGTPAAAYGAQA